MICKDIHELTEGCHQSIPTGKQWKFCPACGSPTGHLQFLDCTLLVERNRSSERIITLRNSGESSIKVNISLKDEVDGFQIPANQPCSFLIAPGMNKTFRLNVPPVRESGKLGVLHVEVNDKPTGEDLNHWCVKPENRVLDVDVVCTVQTPGELHLQQECLIFHDDIVVRDVSLLNQGGTPVNISGITCPTGYRVSVTHGSVQPGSEFTFQVHRQLDVPASSEACLAVTTSDGADYRVRLYSETPEQAREVTAAIIGIDFGTAFTSVAFRECNYSDVLDDDVRFLRPPGEDKDRFPTRIWVDKSKDLAFSSTATERYKEHPLEGYLFREVKTLLRDPDNVKVHPERNGSAAIDFCKTWLGDAWQEKLVTEYLAWLYRAIVAPELDRRFGTTEVGVQYVFTIPVLDYATDGDLYREHRDKMERCVESAGFPGESVEFQFEPVCAAIGLLHPVRNAEDLPRLGDARHQIRNDYRIAVFDSGGGTTDVVMAEAAVDADGKISLSVDSCLGVGSKAETFGGESVTTSLIRAVNNPESVPAKRADWSSGEMHIGNLRTDGDIFDDDGLDYEDDLDVRDTVEKIKADLSADGGTDFRGSAGLVIKPSIFAYLLKDDVKSLTTELNDRVFYDTPKSKIEYYVCVGGNTCVPFIARWVERFMQDDNPDRGNRRLVIPEEQKKLAVAYGAVWIPDASIKNAFPYDVTIRTSLGSDVARFRKNSPQEVLIPQKTYEMPQRGRLDLSIMVRLGNEELRVGTCKLFNPYNSKALLSIRAAIHQGEMRLEYATRDTAAATAEFGEYIAILTYRL